MSCPGHVDQESSRSNPSSAHRTHVQSTLKGTLDELVSIIEATFRGCEIDDLPETGNRLYVGLFLMCVDYGVMLKPRYMDMFRRLSAKTENPVRKVFIQFVCNHYQNDGTPMNLNRLAILVKAYMMPGSVANAG